MRRHLPPCHGGAQRRRRAPRALAVFGAGALSWAAVGSTEDFRAGRAAFAAARGGQPRTLENPAPSTAAAGPATKPAAEEAAEAAATRLGSCAGAVALAGVARHLRVRAGALVRRHAGGGADGGGGGKPTSAGEAVAVAVEEPPKKDEEEPFFEEVSGDDPMVKDLEERLRKQNGNPLLTLEMVLNPGTIVNTEREVILLRAELKATPEDQAKKRKELEDKIEEKQMKIVTEMRQVMTDNLKLEFLSQGILSIPLFGCMACGAFPWYPDLMALSMPPVVGQFLVKVFGAWGIWLVTIPALRARKPGGPYGMEYLEKRALDLSFFLVPFGTFLTPFLVKSFSACFWISLAILVGCYTWSFSTGVESEERVRRRGAGNDLDLPEPMQWILKSWDYGTGSERGADSEDTTWQDQLAAYDSAAEELLEAKKKEPEKQSTKELEKQPTAS